MAKRQKISHNGGAARLVDGPGEAAHDATTHMKSRIFQDSRIGRRRVNQDRSGYAYCREHMMLVLADGMGGHPRGELAAHLAVETLLGEFANWCRKGGGGVRDLLERAFASAHLAIHRQAELERLWDLPRTTCTAAVIQAGELVFGHAGDSRLYLVRDGEIIAISRDHSGAWLLVEQGVIELAEARQHPDRNYVYNCLGGEAGPTIDVSPTWKLQDGDGVLLCSDGLWSAVSDAEIVSVLGEHDPEGALSQLLREAETRAGLHADNLTYLALLVGEAQGPGSIDTQTLEPGEIVVRREEA